MALVPCSECGAQISTAAAACPKCGAPASKEPPLAKKGGSYWWLWIPVIAFAAFMTLGWSESRKPGAEEKSRLRRSIDLCWDEQKRKSLDPGTARFVASTCEMMENDFRAKYGHAP